jgi:small subunit ribosomal protein S2e
VDYFLGPALKDEVMKIMPVQKQTRAGQRTRFKAFVVVGDHNGHVGLGVKCAKEVATAIRGAIISAKLNVVPVRRGYWGNKLGKPHTVPTKITGKGGSVALRLVPAPKGAGIVAASTPKKVLAMAGIVDVYTASTGHTKTMGNFIKATFDALSRTYGFLTPDLWRETRFTKPPAQECVPAQAGYRGPSARADASALLVTLPQAHRLPVQGCQGAVLSAAAGVLLRWTLRRMHHTCIVDTSHAQICCVVHTRSTCVRSSARSLVG